MTTFQLIAAPHTPFTPTGELNLPLIERQAAALVADGVTGAFVCGTTGEGPSLTSAERQQVLARWCAVAGDRLRVIAHVGHPSVAEAAALAAHAQQIGARAIAAIAPSFFKPATVADLVEYCARIAAAAPALPFYYYHLPALSGVRLPVLNFLEQAADRIPTLRGVKFTDEDLFDYSRCLRFDGGRFEILFGRDEILLAGLALGAPGAVGSTYNFAAPVYHRVVAAFAAGDLAAARAAQAEAQEMIAVLIRFGGVPAIKAVMKFRGVDCGPVRPPLRSLTPAEETALRAALEQAGFGGGR